MSGENLNPQNPQNQDPTAQGNAQVKDNVVIIDGKERPLKNYEAELKRKHEEEMQKLKEEYDNRGNQQNYSQPYQQQYQADPWTPWIQAGEQEMTTTGSAFPIKTVAQMMSGLTQKQFDNFSKTQREATKTVNKFKRSMRKSSKDFADIEDDFDDLVDQLQPGQINPQTLEVCLNSVRGKRGMSIEDKVKEAYEKGKKEAEANAKIIAPVDGTGASPVAKSKLLDNEQLRELNTHNDGNTDPWTEEDYVKELKRKTDRFKASGAKNVPHLLSDSMIK